MLVHGVGQTTDAAPYIAWGKAKAQYLLEQGKRIGVLGWRRQWFADAGTGWRVEVHYNCGLQLAYVRAEAGSLKPYGFTWRCRSDAAPYGWRFDEDVDGTTIFVDMGTTQTFSRVRGYVYDWGLPPGSQAEYRSQDTDRQPVVFDTAVRDKISLGVNYWPCNQHAFTWSEDPATGAWVPGRNVWSWSHSSCGDGPMAVTGWGQDEHFSGPTDFGTTRPVSQFTPFVKAENAGGGLLSLSCITEAYYRVVLDPYEHGGSASNGNYPFVIATDNGVDSGVRNAEIFLNGVSWWRQAIGYDEFDDEQELPFPYLEYAEERVDMVAIPIGVAPINKFRALVAVARSQYNAQNKFEYALVLHDLRLDEAGQPLSHALVGGDSLLTIAAQYTVSGGETRSRPYPFFWPWRFSQSIHELSGLLFKQDRDIESTIPGYSIVRKTFALSFDIESDTWSASPSVEVEYPVELVLTANHQYSGPGTTQWSTTAITASIELANGPYPYALDYVDDQLKVCWFTPLNDTLEIDERFDATYDVTGTTILTSSGSIVGSGYLFTEGRGLRGDLDFGGGNVCSLALDPVSGRKTESFEDTYSVTGGAQPGTGNWVPATANRTSNMDIEEQMTPLFVSVRYKTALLAARSLSLSLERELPSTTLVVELVNGVYNYNDEGTASRIDKSGTILRLYRPAGTKTLLNARSTATTSFAHRQPVTLVIGNYAKPKYSLDTAGFRGQETEGLIGFGRSYFFEDLRLWGTTGNSCAACPLTGLALDGLRLGLVEERSPPDAAGPDWMGLRNREYPSYSMAIDPRNDGAILLSVEFSPLDDAELYHNIVYAPYQSVPLHTTYAGKPVATGRYITKFYPGEGISTAKAQRLNDAFDAFLAAIPGDGKSLYPIGLF